MFVKTAEILLKSKAIPAFNTSTFEVAKAIVMAATEANQPVIIQTSENEARFMGPKNVYPIVKALAEASSVPFALHLDHGKDLNLIKECLDSGYSSVMADGTTDFIKEVVLIARQYGAIVEGNTALYDQAKEFVEATGVDLLAPEKENSVNLENIKQVHELTEIPLALHGESAYSAEMIKQSLDYGVKKVNFNTPLRQAYSGTLRELLNGNSAEIVPYKYLDQVIEAVKTVVIEKIDLLRSN